MSSSPSATGTPTTAVRSGWPVTSSSTRSPARYLARDAPLLAERGLHVSGVAGTQFRPRALDSDGLAPGSPLTLGASRPTSTTPNAIAVDAGGAHVGFVPRELAAELAPQLDAGRPWSAVVLREQRASPREPRSGVTMLLAPAPSIELLTRE